MPSMVTHLMSFIELLPLGSRYQLPVGTQKTHSEVIWESFFLSIILMTSCDMNQNKTQKKKHGPLGSDLQLFTIMLIMIPSTDYDYRSLNTHHSPVLAYYLPFGVDYFAPASYYMYHVLRSIRSPPQRRQDSILSHRGGSLCCLICQLSQLVCDMTPWHDE